MYSRSGKTDTLLNLISDQLDIDKIYLYAKDPYKPKCQLLIKKRDNARIKHYDDPNVFMEYSNNIDDVYNNINDCNPNRNRKILIMFDDMIADMNINKEF